MFVFIDREKSTGQAQTIPGDRRAARRYGISLHLKWKLIRRRRVLDSGEGQTLDISSSGMMLEIGKPLPVGFQVELSIAWPVLLHDASPLQLSVRGHIARSEGGRTAIRVARHEFRTVARASERQSSIPHHAPRTAPALSPLLTVAVSRSIH
jgi:hypothetical protein